MLRQSIVIVFVIIGWINFFTGVVLAQTSSSGFHVKVYLKNGTVVKGQIVD